MTEVDLESWKNIGAGRIVVKRFGVAPGMLIEEMVGPGKVVQLTPRERRLNQERAANSGLDVFTNGMLTPVHLIETEADAKELASNANVLSETDMHSLVKAHAKTFDKKLGDITNPIILRRLLEIAREQDCTIKRVESIEARLKAVVPDTIERVTHAPPTTDKLPEQRL